MNPPNEPPDDAEVEKEKSSDKRINFAASIRTTNPILSLIIVHFSEACACRDTVCQLSAFSVECMSPTVREIYASATATFPAVFPRPVIFTTSACYTVRSSGRIPWPRKDPREPPWRGALELIACSFIGAAALLFAFGAKHASAPGIMGRFWRLANRPIFPGAKENRIGDDAP